MGGRERIIKRYVLSSVSRCAGCQHSYDPTCIEIVTQDGDFYLMVVSCPNCRSRGLVAALIREGAGGRQLTDLTETDRARFRDAEPISTDDVLSVHESLDRFGGNFTDLFTRRT